MSTSFSPKSLSLKEKIAQLFIMGFRGDDISADSDILRSIKEDKPGGVILFDKDMVHHKPVHNIASPDQVKNLTAALQAESDLPLFIGIDQEGGLINRLKPEYGFPETKSHHQLGEIDDVEKTQKEGELISEMLKKAGINLNFAPVVDLAKNPKSSIIAKRERCFGKTPEKVIRHAEGYIKGHQKNNVLTCCKHFPGHGSAEGDTHAGFVDVTDTWDESELQPYSYLIEHKLCPIIMTAHIFNANLDADYPSTLSRNVLTGLLRDQLKFDGLLISDDMQMRAISGHYGLKEALKLGFNAGLDVFCFGNNLLKEQVQLSELIQLMLELVDEGSVTESRIDESVGRILKLKESWVN